MGKIKCESHFSHPHPLTLISHHDVDDDPNSSSCSGCKLKPSGMIYSCTLCSFFLHQKCFEMPNTITHPFHRAHALTLLAEPAYPGGAFNCDACAQRGAGFSYHCKPCGIDLHTLCAAAPLSLSAACHVHKLGLAFASPYDTKNFVCDVCGGHGADHWLYRCGACGFDAHLKCAGAAPRQDGGQYSAAAPMHHHPMMGNGAAFGVPAMGVNGQNALALEAIVQMIQSNNAMAQAILARGGGGGGDRGLQQMMQLVSAFNRTGLGGGGIPGLDILGGGGGLESLLGGGGGLDFLGGLGGLL